MESQGVLSRTELLFGDRTSPIMYEYRRSWRYFRESITSLAGEAVCRLTEEIGYIRDGFIAEVGVMIDKLMKVDLVEISNLVLERVSSSELKGVLLSLSSLTLLASCPAEGTQELSDITSIICGAVGLGAGVLLVRAIGVKDSANPIGCPLNAAIVFTPAVLGYYLGIQYPVLALFGGVGLGMFGIILLSGRSRHKVDQGELEKSRREWRENTDMEQYKIPKRF